MRALPFGISRLLQMLVLAIGTGCALSAGAFVTQGLAQGQELRVAVKDYWFEPTYETVAVGSTVTWTNADDESHTVTNDLGMFDQEISPGENWSYTFTQPGVYFYFCVPHDWMIGEITVV